MRVYAWVWHLSAAALAGLAGLTLVVTAGWGTAFATAGAVAMLAGVLSYAWRESFGPPSLSVPGWTVGSAAGAVMFVGLPLMMERLAFVVLIILGVTSPPLVRRLGRRPASGGGVVPRTPAPEPQADPLLAHAWLDTTLRLHEASTPAEVLAVVEERARLLDELEQRDPAAFHAWLGPPAA